MLEMLTPDALRGSGGVMRDVAAKTTQKVRF